MTVARRAFLRLFGMSAAAGPLAAKAALDAEIGKLANISVFGSTGAASSGPAALREINQPPIPTQYISYADRVCNAADLVKIGGMPEYLIDQLREQAQYIYALDHDIAAKRSWSMAIKILTQRQRNFERAKDRIQSDARAVRNKKLFRDLTGYDWPF